MLIQKLIFQKPVLSVDFFNKSQNIIAVSIKAITGIKNIIGFKPPILAIFFREVYFLVFTFLDNQITIKIRVIITKIPAIHIPKHIKPQPFMLFIIV